MFFILDEIANREHIEVRDEDLQAKYQSIADRLRRPIEEVKTYYAREEAQKESLMQQIMNEKTIQWIKDKAIIEKNSQPQKGNAR